MTKPAKGYRRTHPWQLLPLLAFAGIHASAQDAAKPNLSKQPTLYVVGYAHLDTEWRWEYPQTINEFLRKTMEQNFQLFEKYPHYLFNFSGANRYRMMKEYFPAEFSKVKQYVDAGRWFPAGSSMEEGDVNAPSAEAIIRQVLYGNNWFRKEFGKASAEYMLPDCFGFPASLPTILAHAGVKGFSTQKLVWGSSAEGGGKESLEKTPEGTPFNVGVWVGPDGESVLAGLNPGSYSGGIETDLSAPLPPAQPNEALEQVKAKIQPLREKLEQAERSGQPFDSKDVQQFIGLRREQRGLEKAQEESGSERYQGDWAARVAQNGKVTGIYTDYHYFGTGDVGGSPDEDSVKRLEAIVTKGQVELPREGEISFPGQPPPNRPVVAVGGGPVRVISAPADQMFLDITESDAAKLPRYTGEMELTNHSAGSLTSQAYQKRWIRQEEILADAAEKSSVAAEWLGGRRYPLERLNSAWTLVMGGHFHDLAAGTATPKAYEFAWNDDVIAMNQFAGVFRDATEVVSSTLDTAVTGVPVVVFNALNIAREDMVEATINFPGGMPKKVRVTGPAGNEMPAQVSNGKVVFLAKTPSTGYAVFNVEPLSSGAVAGALGVTTNSMENEYYSLRFNADGDMESIFDKSLNRELLSAPARLAISYDNPEQWPAWNMDWDQEQAPPKAYVGGTPRMRIVENGPARVALEIVRDTAGSHFVQTVRLSAGDAGKRVEILNSIDWNTKESNLKATFPLSASNRMATYNLDIGTIQRPTAAPKKFEVGSHQWIDLTDMTGEFGGTILTDCKNGSDKPNDNTVRLTLIRTPGTRGGYSDQATQDLGHHEFVYGFTGHAADWRAAQSDWQGQRLNNPLVAFQAAKHNGNLGRNFSLLQVNNPRIRVLALKRAELTDEITIRLVELDGRPQRDVRVSFATPLVAAREVNGQEQPVGAATLRGGSLVTSFSANQPRTFEVKLGPPPVRIAETRSAPATLPDDVETAGLSGAHSSGGFDGNGNTLAQEMLPAEIRVDGVAFRLAAGGNGALNALTARGQSIDLPAGSYNRVYVLAAALDGDQLATFQIGSQKARLNVQNWNGFVGQWDNRQWIAKDVAIPARGGEAARTEHDEYAEMTGIKPGFIKRADIAWYADHYHNSAGENVPYAYSYLFAYRIDLPPGSNKIVLPNNEKVRIFAVSAAQTTPELIPLQPLYDTLDRDGSLQPGTTAAGTVQPRP